MQLTIHKKLQHISQWEDELNLFQGWMQPAGPDAFSHNMGCQKCLNVCQTVTAVSWTSIGSKKWPLWVILPAEGILGCQVSYLQYPWRTNLATRTNPLSSLRTIFMLISGCTSDFYKIFNTVGKMTLLCSGI